MIRILRWGLPVLLAAAGVVFLLLGGEYNGGIGVMLLGIALIVWIFNGMARLSVISRGDREREQAAREQYSRTGRWPGDADEER